MKKSTKRRKVFVTNNEDRIIQKTRYIEYSINTPLPNDWEDMSIDEQGIWINNNALFIKDSFDEPHYDEISNEETMNIQWDKNE